MRAPPLAVALSILGAAASAQPANETAENMESCFRSARAADAICSDPANDAAKRLECLAKARTAQLECLDKVLPIPSAAAAAPEAPAAATPDPPTGTLPDAAPGAAIAPEKPAAEPVTAAPPDQRSEIPPDPLPADPVSPPPAETIPPQPAPADIPATRRSLWIVSETTSPLDYSPLIIAVVRATATQDNAPASLTIRCRAQRADVLVGTQGAWRASPAGELQVEYQVGERTAVRQPWMASPDGKTARYMDDAAAWLRTLPDDGRLRVGVFDGQDQSHETTFQLDGLDAVRKKIELACKPTVAGAAPARVDRGEFRRGRADDGGGKDGGRHRRTSADDTAANRTYRSGPTSRSR